MDRAMDPMVLRSMAKWPDVPDVYGWLSLDRRGNWLLKGERIGNQALRDFISRNYQPDKRGCWYFQNGPQRVLCDLPMPRSSSTTRAMRCLITVADNSMHASTF